ncbi:AraC family transcriptional regulator [Salegentibacter mishustinae]|uniref:AraC family transcriptional regulator n=1 Tax=Salegentibacter mishustinae TaxID=270918 RepID=A0A0Q9ZDC4_9FLAO|nr:helix-turn-helix domain-containing protein [Salegentibacter mishustinae]KRG27150.1 AraC family transcriptional regulator [Salegentibacter mishustinae]PNW21383.1 AraC family transcriptional regulator [Salegentibacter mishustinae]PZX62678.1 AraC-like DNA-binding protein [Salegentibacter mishustinae]GGW97498.1 AraC family transcriptional regulator [Salegentibacter mishustinae]
MVKISKPSFEKVDPSFGSSFSFKSFNQENQNRNHTFWHYHPEIELVYVNGGSGKRQIGSHISYYQHGDLILIGSNLPHCGFTDSLTDNDKETVIQFSPDFLGKNFWEIPEMRNVRVLLERAKNGIVFHGEDKNLIGEKIEALSSLTNYKRLLGLLDVLNMLENAKDFTLLNAEGFVLDTELEDHNRINVIFNFVKNEFKRNIALEEIADVVSMTVPAFCRYFKKTTGKTFVQFVNEYRLVHAAKLLHEKQISITDVCFESGFNNFSHFNKQFKKFTGKSPSVYRNEIKFAVS